MDKGLKLYHNRDKAALAYQVARRIQAARECLHEAVPEMMERLESKVFWETLKTIPGQVTAKEIAFWLGRCLRSVKSLDGDLTIMAVVAGVGSATLIIAGLDTAVGTPAALEAVLETSGAKVRRGLIRRRRNDNGGRGKTLAKGNS